MHMFAFVCGDVVVEELLFEADEEVEDVVELLVLVAARLAGSLNGNKEGNLKGVVGFDDEADT